MTIRPLHLVLLAGFMGFAYAETAMEIVEKFDKQKVEALEAYLAANPEAEDRGEAVDALLEAYPTLGAQDKMLPLMVEKYDAVKGTDLREQLGLLGPIVQLYAESGQKDKAQALLEDAPKHLGDQASNPQILGYIEQLGSQLALPSKGDEMPISFTSIAGKEVDTMKMEGKVVLVDFWATWCGPCIAEMPNVISAYEKWNDKGFEIVGISLDSDKGALESYIKENNMPWAQYFDGKGWQNELADKFGINSIPATFLLKDGKILATNLRGDALENALSEHLGGEG